MLLGLWTFGLKPQRPQILELQTKKGRSAAKGIEEMEKEIGRGRRELVKRRFSQLVKGETDESPFLYLSFDNFFPFYAIQTNAHTNNQRELMYLLFQENQVYFPVRFRKNLAPAAKGEAVVVAATL
jgi:hypothetical protein